MIELDEPCFLGLRQASTPAQCMQLHLITGNEVAYQKSSFSMRMLKVTSMSYKALVKRCKISSMLKETGDALAPVLMGE